MPTSDARLAKVAPNKTWVSQRGKQEQRRFNVVLVTKDAPKPLDLDSPEGQMVNYNGKVVNVKL